MSEIVWKETAAPDRRNCAWNGMNAFVEPAASNPDEEWFCCVYWPGHPKDSIQRAGDIVFHSVADEITPKTEQAARRLCELVMKAQAAHVEAKK